MSISQIVAVVVLVVSSVSVAAVEDAASAPTDQHQT